MVVKMRIKTTGILILWGLLIFSSCDEQMPIEEAQSDPITNPQFVFMRESNLLYFSASFELEFGGESLTSALVEWSTQNGSPADSIWLNDVGEHGDLLAFDRVYSHKIQNDLNHIQNIIIPSLVGQVTYRFLGFYGIKSVELSQTSYVENIPPVILSLSAADIITRPSGTELEFVLVSADVFDMNGLDDILNCGFTSLHVGPDTLLNNGEAIWLYDDGGIVEIFPGYYSGDEISGDGKFSFQIPIFGTGNTDPAQQTKPGTFLWTFTAKDKSNDLSGPMEHTVVVE